MHREQWHYCSYHIRAAGYKITTTWGKGSSMNQYGNEKYIHLKLFSSKLIL